MAKILRDFINRDVIHPGQFPRHIPDSVQYLTSMGSIAYGVSSDDSDWDIYGWCIPEKRVIFPHLDGHIPGFGTPPEPFEQWQLHHVIDPRTEREYDFTIYNVVKYFGLCMASNPNVLESLFTSHHAIMHISPTAQLVRDRRHLFLCRAAWHRFKGYAYAQRHALKSKEPPIGKRKALVDQFGFDVKFAYHIVRLTDEIAQILTEENLDLTRNAEKLKAIRRGEWKIEDIENYFTDREKELEIAYQNSELPLNAREPEIRQLLLDVLEHHYGNLSDAVVDTDAATRALSEIERIVGRYRQSS